MRRTTTTGPVAMYLSELSEGSRRTMRFALSTAAVWSPCGLSGETGAERRRPSGAGCVLRGVPADTGLVMAMEPGALLAGMMTGLSGGRGLPTVRRELEQRAHAERASDRERLLCESGRPPLVAWVASRGEHVFGCVGNRRGRFGGSRGSHGVQGAPAHLSRAGNAFRGRRGEERAAARKRRMRTCRVRDNADRTYDEIRLPEIRHHQVRAVDGDHVHMVGRELRQVSLHLEPCMSEATRELPRHLRWPLVLTGRDDNQRPIGQ